MLVFAHPDDETFACGGTVARYTANGNKVVEVCASRGEVGQTGDPPLVDQTGLGAFREQELRCASRVLGIEPLIFLDCIDGSVTDYPRLGIVGKVVREVRKHRPQVVISFGSDGASAHPDHIAVSSIATDAFLAAPDPLNYPEHILNGLKPWAPAKLYYVAIPRNLAILRGFPLAGVQDWLITTPIDIVSFHDQKIKAAECHRTQAKDFQRFLRLNGGKLPDHEYFRLAISRVGSIDVQEDDLFAGLI
jgi:N-acetylglucosamine malate deacetylase 2